MTNRLIVISNRLPVTVDYKNGVLPAPGGLITAISSYMEKQSVELFSEILWVGVPGCKSDAWFSAINKFESTRSVKK